MFDTLHSPSTGTPQSGSKPGAAEAASLLADIEMARARLCRWHRLLSRVIYRKAMGEKNDADVTFARDRFGVAWTKMEALRERLKREHPRAWRIHTYGLALVREYGLALVRETDCAKEDYAKEDCAEQGAREEARRGA